MKYTISLLSFLICILCTSCGKKHSLDYRIGIDPSWYPLEVAGREKNILAFSSELLQEIARMKHVQLGVVTMNWDNLLWGLREGKYEAVLTSMQPYIFYEKQYDFSELYLPTGPVLIVPIKSSLNSLEKMQGKEIAVIRGSPATILLQNYPGVILRAYDSIPEALNAIVSQDVDAGAIDLLLAQAYVRDLYYQQLKIVGEPLNQYGLRMMSMTKDTSPLIRDFNQALEELKKTHRYEAMLKKWGLTGDTNYKVENEEKLIDHLLQYVIL